MSQIAQGAVALRGRLMGWLRRVSRELVSRRERVVLVPTQAEPANLSSGFILGVHRSGTTPLRFALDSHPEVAVPGETNFLVDLLTATTNERALAGLRGIGVDRQLYRDALVETATRFYESYTLGRKPAATMWIDKSPRYVPVAGLLAEAFGSAHLILLVRHPLAQTYSSTVGGSIVPEYLASENAVDSAAEHWLRSHKLLAQVWAAHSERTTLVSYEALCEHPRQELVRVVSGLGLQWSESVLDYGSQPHTAGLEGGKALAHDGFVQMGRRVRWGSAEAARVWRVCGEAASEFGYAVDGTGTPQRVDLERGMGALLEVDNG